LWGSVILALKDCLTKARRFDSLRMTRLLKIDAGIEILIFDERGNKILNSGKPFFFDAIDYRASNLGTFGDPFDFILF